MSPDPSPATDEQVGALREAHEGYEQDEIPEDMEPWCKDCYEPWPCPTARLITRMDAAEAESVAAEAALRVAAKGIDGLRSALLTAEAERDALRTEVARLADLRDELQASLRVQADDHAAALARAIPEGWRVEWRDTLDGMRPRLAPYRPEDTKGGDNE